MANEFKLLVDELKYKLTVAFNRINKLELELQEKVSYIYRLQEELGLKYSMKQSIANKEERKSNGKS
tara:strand:- start:281 stop:481 length:201 start_codon:yes stop_codon:yes gene_type:complete